MSVISKNIKWKGVTLEQRVNTDTGQTEVYTIPRAVFGNPIGPGVKVAETFQDGAQNKWRFTDKTTFKVNVNNALRRSGSKPLTEEQFNKEVNNSAYPQLNLNRALILNDNDNYATQAIARANRSAAFNNNIPLVVDPTTGAVVSSKGVKSTTKLTGNQEVEDDGLGDPLLTEDDVRNERDKARGGPKGKGTGKNATPGKILRYPLDEPSGPFKYDYISITAHDYKPSKLDFNYDADKNLGPAYERVIFPMQPQLSETNAVNWSDDQLNPVQMALGKAAIGAIKGIGTLNLQTIGDQFTDLAKTVGDVFDSPDTKAFAAAYFAGQAVGANLVGRSTGMVINPNLELLFNGPNLRTFNFNFRLTPRFKEESEIIREIIFAFKRNMAVQRSKANLFLRSPRLFQLKYVYEEGNQHPYLNKFKPCAMTNFQVNYTPDGSYATYEGTGSLTAYDLTMSFSEVMPIYVEDNEYTENPTDMGF